MGVARVGYSIAKTCVYCDDPISRTATRSSKIPKFCRNMTRDGEGFASAVIDRADVSHRNVVIWILYTAIVLPEGENEVSCINIHHVVSRSILSTKKILYSRQSIRILTTSGRT